MDRVENVIKKKPGVRINKKNFLNVEPQNKEQQNLINYDTSVPPSPLGRRWSG
jgi:hypothetical protein